MNAAEKATSIAITSKIATIANLLRLHIPSAQIDFSPWVEDEVTHLFEDQQSIDLSINFPRYCTDFASRCLLVQIHLPRREVGSGGLYSSQVEFSGYGYDGSQQWRYSTGGDCAFVGKAQPIPAARLVIEKLSQVIIASFHSLADVDLRELSQ